MYKKMKKNGLLLAVSVMAVTMLFGGCGKKNKMEEEKTSESSVVMLVGSHQVKKQEVQVYRYLLKCQYEASFGKKLWKYHIGENQTIGDQAKKEIVNMITQVKIISDEAEKEKIELNADEKDEALQKAETIYSTASSKDIEKYNLTIQDLQKVYEENALANKMFYVATDDVDTNVSDEEARQMSIQYIEIVTNGTDFNGKKISLNEEEKKNALERITQLKKEAESTDDFLTFAQQNTEAENTELVIGQDSDSLEQTVLQKALSMKTGEVSDVIEGRQGYYLIRCVNEMDETATHQKKEEIIEKRQMEEFTSNYKNWMSKKKVDINQSFWNEFAM